MQQQPKPHKTSIINKQKMWEHFQSRVSESEKVRQFANSSNSGSELGIVEINQRVKYIEEIYTYTVHQKGCLLKM